MKGKILSTAVAVFRDERVKNGFNATLSSPDCFCIEMGSDESRFIASLTVRDKGSVHKPHLLRRKETWSGIQPKSFCLATIGDAPQGVGTVNSGREKKRRKETNPNSEHWFTISLLQPLPQLVTPQVSSNRCHSWLRHRSPPTAATVGYATGLL